MEKFSHVDRKVIPRWRSLMRTPGDELQSCCKPRVQKDNQEALQARLKVLYEHWRNKPTLENAGEVIDLAVHITDPSLAVGPAQMILTNDNSSPAAKDVAQYIIKGPFQSESSDAVIFVDKQSRNQQIRELKNRLNYEPANGILWLEKARLHTLFGELENAELSLRRAFGSAPNNRFILRAYSRFLIHTDRLDEAHYLLISADALKEDPWVQAAEISIAELANRKPVSVKIGRNILERGDLSSIHLSELRSSLATLELNNGAVKKAKRLYAASMDRANENTVAQALWAVQEKRVQIGIDEKYLRMPNAYEARVKKAIQDKDWALAIDQCDLWLNDEAFSVGAALEGSYLSSGCKMDENKSLHFCKKGLDANPHDKGLLNNKAVALSRLGRYKEAKKILDELQQYIRTENPDPTILATNGLYNYCIGETNIGAQFYDLAVDSALDQGKLETAIRARFHWFYEACKAMQISASDVDEYIERIDKSIITDKLSLPSIDSWHIMRKKIDREAILSRNINKTEIDIFKAKHQLILS